jgi:hypothetical protein
MIELQLMATASATNSDHSKGSWVGYAAATWAFIFAVLHIVWATGWYVGLQDEAAKKAFEKPWFLMYDLIVVGMCLIAAAVALALVQPWGRRLPRWLVGILAWAGTSLLVLRAGGSAVQSVYLAATGKFVPHPGFVWDIWFGLGALLFALTLWRYYHSSKVVS